MAKLLNLKKNKNGESRWGVRWYDIALKKERQRSFTNRREAVEFRAQKDLEAPPKRQNFSILPDREVLMRDIVSSYIDHLQRPEPGEDPKEPITLKTYRSILNTHVLPHIEELQPSEVTEQTYKNIHKVCEQIGVSPRTRNEALRLLKVVLGYAKDQGHIDYVPDNPIKQKMNRAERQTAKRDSEKKFYSPDAVYTMLAAADSLAKDENKQTRKTWARYRPMVYMLVYTGARISEVRGFRRRDYDSSSRWIHINYSAPEGEGSDDAKATASIRKVPFNPELQEPLETWLDSHEHELVFCTNTGKAISLTTLYPRLLEALKDRADALAASGADPRYTKIERDRTFHAFRHHYAAWLVREGANFKQLQSYMGHAKASFTLDVYGHLFDDDGEELMQKMTMKPAPEPMFTNPFRY